MNDEHEEDLTELNISFSISGSAVEPGKISEELGLVPSHSHRRGDVYESRSGQMLERYNSVWTFSSEGKVPEPEPNAHVDYVLNNLEPLKDRLFRYIADKESRVSIAIWWKPDGGSGGYTVTSTRMVRLAQLASEVDLYFVGD